VGLSRYEPAEPKLVDPGIAAFVQEARSSWCGPFPMGKAISGGCVSAISVGPPCRGGLSPQGEPRGERPLNGVALSRGQRGAGRRLQQAAKSFPAERTYISAYRDPTRRDGCFENHRGGWGSEVVPVG